jgi:ribonuclease BN (tRNA processing enzyme)
MGRARLDYEMLRAGEERAIGPWRLRTFPLHHYAGDGPERHDLESLGYRLSLGTDGPTVVYLADHEPTPATASLEAEACEGAHLALFDAYYPDRADQKYGHGSVEHAARMARDRPALRVLAVHCGAEFADAHLRAAQRRHGPGLANFQLGVEGRGFRWDTRARRFAPRR